jgi:uncharacterized protein YjbJ (UPF0337 family)
MGDLFLLVRSNKFTHFSKVSAKFHQTKGSLKESLGRTFRAPGMQQRGAQERAEGHAEYQAATGRSSYGQGTKERIAGKKDQVLGSLTGDRAQQTKGYLFSVQSNHSQLIPYMYL